MTIDCGERKAWARSFFRGIENVLMPSFKPGLRELDEEGIRLDVEQSIRHGFFSTACALDAGLTQEEQRRMLAIACDAARGRMGVSLPLIGESIDANLTLLRWAEAAGATHATVYFPQSFSPRTQDDVHDFVSRIASETTLGLCLSANERSSFHALHPSGIAFEAYERLADLPNVIALQLGGGDAGLTLECFERFSARVLVTTNNVGMLPMLRQNFGVQWIGPWSAEGVQSPEQPHAVTFMRRLLEDQIEAAMEVYWRIAPALGASAKVLAPLAMTGAQHWPMLKYQQWLSGGNGGMTRQPCMRMFERDMQVIRGGLRAVGVQCPDGDDAFFAGRCTAGARS